MRHRLCTTLVVLLASLCGAPALAGFGWPRREKPQAGTENGEGGR